jgi:hypothetical protein
MPSIQVLSDLHLEAPKSYDIFCITPTAPYLALLGDIGCVRDEGYLLFLEKQLSQFKIVFLLLGNHEPYHSSWEFVKEKIHKFEQGVKARDDSGELVLLDQTRYDLSSEVTILGCTLFSKILPEQEQSVSFGLNDFYHIDSGSWTVEDHASCHISDLAFLNRQVAFIAEHEPERKIIILTHYSPTLSSKAVDPAQAGSKIGSGFATDLRGEACWESRNVKVWAFGHTHYNCDFDLDGKRVLANQRGYYFKVAKAFEEGKVVTLE